MENIITLLFPHIFYLLAISFATMISCKWLTRKRNTTPLPPGPTNYPIVGCLPQMVINKPTSRWIHKLMQEMDTEIACFHLGNTRVIPVTSPELAREFLKKHDAIFATRPSMMSSRLISDGYLTTIMSVDNDQWKKMRKVLSSEVLSSTMHKKMHDKRSEEADHLVRYVYNQCISPLKDGLVNVRVTSQHYCGGVIKKLIFNKRVLGIEMEDGGPGADEIKHMEALFTVLSHLFGFAIADFAPWLEVFDLDGHKKIVLDALRTAREYQDSEIDKRVEMWRQGTKSAKDDILDVFINLKNSENQPLLSVPEIKAEILELMLATVDNPSNAVEWSIAEMINQPSILDKACKELDRVVGRDRLVQESDLPRLNYIKACARESLRLHPLAPFNVPHVSTEDVVVGGYFIPKGSYVILSRLGLGRNSEAWENPLEYNPERHLVGADTEVGLVDHDLKMLSFSTGRRGCPAIVLGSTITAMLLARLIQCFHWKTPPDTTTIVTQDSDTLQMEKPLILQGIPRLERHVYRQLY